MPFVIKIYPSEFYILIIISQPFILFIFELYSISKFINIVLLLVFCFSIDFILCLYMHNNITTHRETSNNSFWDIFSENCYIFEFQTESDIWYSNTEAEVVNIYSSRRCLFFIFIVSLHKIKYILITFLTRPSVISAPMIMAKKYVTFERRT